MMGLFRSAVLVLLGISLSACGNFFSVHRDFSPSNGTGALIDIKQRAIIVTKNKKDEVVEKTIGDGKTTKTTKTTHDVSVCAEPSPDAMSAYAGELAGKLNLSGDKAVEMAQAMRESAAFTGLRTQSIQLLRDSMYRLCEARMNQSVSQSEYEIMMRRSQKHMVALLAIEQLTGVVKAAPVTLTSTSSISIANQIDKTLSQIKDNTKSIADKEKEIEDIKKDAKLGDLAKGEKIAPIQTQVDELKAENGRLEQAVKNDSSILTSGSSASAIVNVNTQSNITEQTVSKIVDSVKKIVDSVTSADDTGQLCFAFIKDGYLDINADKPLNNYCNEFFKAQGAVFAKKADLLKTISGRSVKEVQDDAEKIEVLSK